MKFASPQIAAVLFSAGLFFHCSKDPVFIVPDTTTAGITISGYVRPLHVDGTVYLVSDAPVDSCSIDTSTGYFIFTDVEPGSYLLQVRAPGWGNYELITTLSSRQSYQITLSELPSQIKQVSAEDSSIVGWYNCIPDSLSMRYQKYYVYDDDTAVGYVISFYQKMDESSLRHALSVDSAIPYTATYTYSSIVNELRISVKTVELFRHGVFSLSLDTTARTVYGAPLDFTLRHHFLVARDCLNRAVLCDLVNQTTPADGYSNADPFTDVFVSFRRPVVQPSIDSAVSVSPPVPFALQWMGSASAGQVLRITFPGGLSSDTRYRITIDTTARTGDSLPLAAPVSISFTTAAFRLTGSTPYSGQNGFPVDSPFTFSFNTPIDSESFATAFSTDPPLAAPSFALSDSAKKITVHHYWLTAQTHYTLTVDTLLRSTKGARLMFSKHLEFTTGTYPSLIRRITPPDTLVPVSTTTAVIFDFSTPMDAASITARLSFTPPVPFSTRWETDSLIRLTITPLQPLRCSARYTVTLDSGYTSGRGTAGSELSSAFITEPLAITGFGPPDGQIGTPVAAPLRLQFNAPVDTAGFAGRITVSPPLDSMTVTCTDSSGCSAFSIGHRDFISDTLYTVTIGTGVTDRYGAALPAAFTFSFSTGAP